MKKLLTLTALSLSFLSIHAQQAKMPASPAYDNVHREKQYKDSRSVAHQVNYVLPDRQDKVRPTHGISYYKGNTGVSTQPDPVVIPSKGNNIRKTAPDNSVR
jgi:hypothetical protein